LHDDGLIHSPAGRRRSQEGDELLEAIRTFSVDHELEDDVCLGGTEFAGKPPQKTS
jgi:hypothetical protein